MKPPEGCAGLGDVREAIDALDREIVALLGRRSRYVERAAAFKTSEAGVRVPDRQRAMLAERRLWAESEGLDADFVEGLFGVVISHFVNREVRDWRSTRSPDQNRPPHPPP